VLGTLSGQVESKGVASWHIELEWPSGVCVPGGRRSQPLQQVPQGTKPVWADRNDHPPYSSPGGASGPDNPTTLARASQDEKQPLPMTTRIQRAVQMYYFCSTPCECYGF
jgi:hypothetical protein